MIQLKNIKKVFRTSSIETAAVADVSLHIKEGEFLAIMGSSGSGKSTLLSLMGLLDTITSGTYLLQGLDVSRASTSETDRIRRELMGFVFQNYNLLPNLSVLDNVELALKYRGFKKMEYREKALNSLRAVGMEARVNHYPSQLSGGQQQRTAIARALVSNPKLIFADEPTGNLDSANGKIVTNLLKRICKEGTTIVMVTHSESQANEAERILSMKDGIIDEAVINY